jgi:elongation factor G
VDILPSPVEVKAIRGKNASGAEVECKADVAEPAAALVFKVLSEQHLGDLSLIRIFSGKLTQGQELMNVMRSRPEKLGALYQLIGKERHECPVANAGDIVAAVKLKETHTADTLADRQRPVTLPPPEFPKPVTTESLHPKNKGDEEKVAQGLARLHEEDPTFGKHFEPSTKETLVSGMGDLHLEVMVDRLKKRFGVEVLLNKPRVPYRETVRQKAEDQYRRSRPVAVVIGEVHLRIEPRKRVKASSSPTRSRRRDPDQFIPAVESVVAGMIRPAGRLSGGGRQGRRVLRQAPRRRFHRKWHSRSRSRPASAGGAQGVTGVTEPIDEITVRAPEEFLGDVRVTCPPSAAVSGHRADGCYQCPSWCRWPSSTSTPAICAPSLRDRMHAAPRTTKSAARSDGCVIAAARARRRRRLTRDAAA